MVGIQPSSESADCFHTWNGELFVDPVTRVNMQNIESYIVTRIEWSTE